MTKNLGRYAYQRKATVVQHAYGWVPDLPDQRDHQYLPMVQELPQAVDLRSQMPPVYDQGALGSCTANAIAAAIQFDQIKQGLPTSMPSRLFIYYNERAMEHTIHSDAGAMIRDGIKSVANLGECAETLWPYDITQFTVKPVPSCYSDATKHLALTYKSLDQDLVTMQSCLADGYPFVVGITVYQSFEGADVAQTGTVPMPGLHEAALGGHAVACCGYDNSDQTFLMRNSWGAGWGRNGYFTLPYAYLLSNDLADDFWTIRTME